MTIDQAAVVKEKEDVFEVWSDNWQAVSGFLVLETQWRTAATMAGIVWLGLDYGAAAATLGKRRFRRLRKGLKTMEIAALDVLNQRGDG